jgi:pyruvate dehydrogenase E2 component (dihydrolipoamide acetyltransferase)
MAVDVLMPNLGFDTQSAKLIEWLKQPGDTVKKGDPIALIESDKSNVELEALANGVLLEHRAAADQDVDIGAVIARIGSANEYQPAAAPSPAPVAAIAPVPARDDSTAKVTPVAQRVARELQVPVEQIAGSGGRGRITRRDVEAFHKDATPTLANGQSHGADAHGIQALPRVRKLARDQGIALADVIAAGYANPITEATLTAFRDDNAQPEPQAPTPQPQADPVIPAGATHIPLSRMRQTIAKRLSESMREAPHFYVTGEFVFDAALARLKSDGANVTINTLMVYLTAQALAKTPALNATFQNGALYQHSAVNMALAVSREDGLITPVVHDVGRYSLSGLTGEIRALVDRARHNRLSADDLQGGTFTLSNMGMIAQVDHFTAVINPPQVAILAVGALKPRPVVIDGGLFVRSTAHLTLSGDHRVVDGMDLARFMTAFQDALDRFSA